MDAVAEEGRLLDVAKNKAIVIADAFGEVDDYQLLSNAFEGKSQRLIDKSTFSQEVEELQSDPAARKLSDIIKRQKDALKQSGAKTKTLVVLSDFQTVLSDFENIENDSSYNIWLMPLKANNNSNIYITA